MCSLWDERTTQTYLFQRSAGARYFFVCFACPQAPPLSEGHRAYSNVGPWPERVFPLPLSGPCRAEGATSSRPPPAATTSVPVESQTSEARRRGSLSGGQKIAHQKSTSEIIVDFQWHVPMDFQWNYPTDVQWRFPMEFRFCDFWCVMYCPDCHARPVATRMFWASARDSAPAPAPASAGKTTSKQILSL